MPRVTSTWCGSSASSGPRPLSSSTEMAVRSPGPVGLRDPLRCWRRWSRPYDAHDMDRRLVIRDERWWVRRSPAYSSKHVDDAADQAPGGGQLPRALVAVSNALTSSASHHCLRVQ